MTAQEDKVIRLDPDGGVRPVVLRPSPRRAVRWVLLGAVPLVAVAVALAAFFAGGRYQVTDDARLRAPRVAISANVPGRVVDILVEDNETVRQGQVLFRLDPAPYDAAVRAARAELAAARLEVQVARSAYAPRAAELAAAQSERSYQLKEYERQRILTERGVAPRRDLDVRANELAAAEGRVSVAEAAMRQAAVAAGGGISGPVEDHPAVRQAAAALDRALLDRTYTEVKAPQDGVVTRVEQLQVGSTITAAQPLYSLVAGRVWIEANFRENQLAHLRVGQAGLATIDALPGQKLPVRVGSLSPGAASVFALLPPENASGNWVKVTQRLPVRVEFDRPVDPELYRAGLSARVRIDTGYRRTWRDLLLPFAAWTW